MLEINIPQLKFSEVQNTVDEDGYIHIPYRRIHYGHIQSAMVVASILAVIMIIIQGVKITTLGGEEK